ncbi:hypothetical protein BU25DRAFT_453904 [Macroventuria anomochaeta]|uniref:Uncharacterized protein n=1 Tax=Macroventuria anomochaeta TaxID=301207 RepID=A0ACB6SFA2_9PLEO|nr:uncharacterized protein BU25DRAFT_453904 [Macroventuria anomochaeta]KAF2632719.1 hypothetical protein BU25DRAFT_453904 [Macroventuria anomochaeta]
MADDFTCPSGGKWYACPSTSTSKFVGCCASETDPCSTGCALGSIRTVAFNESNYEKFPDASCGVNSNFYTCSPGGQKTFWGCCKSVPCGPNPACPDGSLTPAFVDQPAQIAFYIASQTVSGTSSTSSATSSATSSSSERDSKSNGAAIGGAVGGALGGVLIISLIVFFLLRRRRSQQTARGETVEVVSPMMEGGKAFDPNSPNFAAQSPPPTYSATNGGYYQSIAPTGKGNPYTQSPYSQGQWAHTADGPQEMEADVGPSNRYSELPAEASRPGTHHRYSELSTGPSCRVSPHHSPKASQTENTVEPKPQGLGVVTEDTRP